jgi:hypothetical protein
MPHGIRVFNQYGHLLFDNDSGPVMCVVEEGQIAKGSYITVNREDDLLTYVRALTPDQNIYGLKVTGAEPAGAYRINLDTSSGNIGFVRVRPVSIQTAAGYGLAVYNRDSTPKLVFGSSFKNARILLDIRAQIGNANVVYNFPASLPGQYKYINAMSFTPWKVYKSGLAEFLRFKSNADGTVVTLGTRQNDIYPNNVANIFSIFQNITLIEV